MAAFTEILFVVAGSAYVVLLLLLLWSPGGGITRAILAATCATTAASAGIIAVEWATALRPSGAISELLRTGPWCVFLLHLLNKQRGCKFVF